MLFNSKLELLRFMKSSEITDLNQKEKLFYFPINGVSANKILHESAKIFTYRLTSFICFLTCFDIYAQLISITTK